MKQDQVQLLGPKFPQLLTQCMIKAGNVKTSSGLKVN